MLVVADDILKANPEKKVSARIRYRGGRPAWNWLKKHDEQGAAALWLIARQRLPQAANDNLPTEAGLRVDRRKDGKPRGKNRDPRSLDAYLALPAVQPRLGDAERTTTMSGGNWDGRSRGVHIKPQAWLHPDASFTDATRFSWHPPAIAAGAVFLGAIVGFGKAKPGKSRGDIRYVDSPNIEQSPEEVEAVIETILSGGNVADVGKALGARGGYAVRRGGAALLAAGRWAKAAIANDNMLPRASSG